MGKKIIIIALSILCILLAGCPKTSDKQGNNQERMKIVFVYPGPVEDSGWTFAHERARKIIQRELPFVDTSCVESVTDTTAAQILDKCAREGNRIVVGTSIYYTKPIADVADRHPETIFLHCSGTAKKDNLASFFGRMYQARFLTGLIAGSMTKTNKIGYVAAHPEPEVIRGLNAFTIGVRKVNPKAVVMVQWTKTWYDPVREREIAEELMEQGCDILAQHQDSPATQLAAQQNGIYCIGYNSDMSVFAPKAHLVSAVWNWEVYYKNVIREVRNGTWKPGHYWGGLKDGVVDISPISPTVPDNVKQMVEKYRQDILKGDFDVFDGPLKDKKGKIVIKLGENFTDEQLLKMNFFVEGVTEKTKK